jgi:hypothetical protein
MTVEKVNARAESSRGWGELGNSLGSFGDSVSSELTGKEELDCSLYFTGRESSALVESDELGWFKGDSFEGVVNERVHDVHGLLGNTNIGVNLLQYLEDIDSEGFWSLLLVFLIGGGSLLHLLFNNCGSLLGSHFYY